ERQADVLAEPLRELNRVAHVQAERRAATAVRKVEAVCGLRSYAGMGEREIRRRLRWNVTGDERLARITEVERAREMRAERLLHAEAALERVFLAGQEHLLLVAAQIVNTD